MKATTFVQEVLGVTLFPWQRDLLDYLTRKEGFMFGSNDVLGPLNPKEYRMFLKLTTWLEQALSKAVKVEVAGVNPQGISRSWGEVERRTAIAHAWRSDFGDMKLGHPVGCPPIDRGHGAATPNWMWYHVEQWDETLGRWRTISDIHAENHEHALARFQTLCVGSGFPPIGIRFVVKK